MSDVIIYVNPAPTITLTVSPSQAVTIQTGTFDVSSIFADTKFISTHNADGTELPESVLGKLKQTITGISTIIATQGVDALGNRWFVDASVGASGDGKTPATAFKTIQEGHDAASEGDSIIIKKGTYLEEAYATGLTITKNNLRFLSAPPYQVTIDNSRVDATHSVYLDTVSNVGISNSIFGGGGVHKGLEVVGAASQFNRVSECITISCTTGITYGGTACLLENYISVFDLNAIDFTTGGFNILKNVLGITFFVPATSRGIIFRAGSTLNILKDIQLGGYGYALESEVGPGANAIIEKLVTAMPLIGDVLDPANHLIIAGYEKPSLIATNSSLQDDLKTIYDALITLGIGALETEADALARHTLTYEKIQAFGTLAAGILNDVNGSDEITTAETGATCYIGISLQNVANTDDFDIALQRWDGAAWRTYSKIKITKAAGVISLNEGGGAVATNLDEISWEDIYLDSTRKLQLVLTKNSATDRDFPYFVNKKE